MLRPSAKTVRGDLNTIAVKRDKKKKKTTEKKASCLRVYINFLKPVDKPIRSGEFLVTYSDEFYVPCRITLEPNDFVR